MTASVVSSVRDIVLDGHVHYHTCFDPAQFLDSAVGNLYRGGHAAGLSEAPVRCLLFTECARDDFFGSLQEGKRNAACGSWKVTPTDEDCSLLATRSDTDSLVLVAGRQLITREGLEVLAIGCRARFPDGLPISEAIDAVLAQNAIPVIPWAFGKWCFGKGRLLEALLRAPTTSRIFLGDNSGRPSIAPPPRLFALGEERGFFLLPGSDPLPFPAQVKNVGRYGFLLRGAFDPLRPATSIRRLITSLDRQPPVFGRREGLAGFLRSQIAIQLRNRRGAASR